MAAYRMTPARRAALEKAQAASARKRRKGGNRRRTSRSRNRKALAVVAVAGAVGGTVAAQHVVSRQAVNRRIVARHVELASYQHQRLNSLRAGAFPTTALTNPPFDADAARHEAIQLLSRTKRRKKRT